MNTFSKWITLGLVGLFALYLATVMAPHGDAVDSWHWREFGSLPVQEGGRVKPLDTLARTYLKILNRREEYRDDKGNTLPATKWLLDVATASRKPAVRENNPDLDREVFRIQDKNTVAILGLPERNGHRYSVNEFFARIGPLLKKMEEIKKKDPKNLTAPENELLTFFKTNGQGLIEQFHSTVLLFNLNQKVIRIENEEVLDTLQLKPRSGLRYAASEFMENLEDFFTEYRRAVGIDPKKRNMREVKLTELYERLGLVFQLANGKSLTVVPPPSGSDSWQSPEESNFTGQASPYEEKFQKILDAYASDDRPAFNEAVHDYRKAMDKDFPALMTRVDLEQYFNEAAPFYYCAILYLFVFLLCCLSWLSGLVPQWNLFQSLNRAAFWATLLIFLVHTWALVTRMYLQGRPPVTNLYSSAIFIGWGCVLMGLVAEGFFGNSIALSSGSVCGAATLFIAQYLGLSGDTMEMLQAVLDTDFWLATHVTCITLGYTASFLAGKMGIAFILLGLFTHLLAGDGVNKLRKMMYGVICFAMFFSFFGTVLGGLWADYSWGRFWGWDPKENGALLIVLWNALILHARWAGMVKPRGMAVLAVLGNIVTSWSWFGVNMLGIGLHSYGFMHGADKVLIGYDLCMLVIAGLGLIPLKYWRSFRSHHTAAPVPHQDPVLASR